jgi:hypothetical protein
MKFQLNFQFLAIFLVSCPLFVNSISPFFTEQLALIEAEIENAQPQFSALIKPFFSLKSFYTRFESLLSEIDTDLDDDEPPFWLIVKAVLLKYFTLVVCFYNNSPLESLKAVRLYGNFEFIYLFSYYIRFKENAPIYSVLEGPFKKILIYRKMTGKFLKWEFNIQFNYGRIVKKILDEPFRISLQAQQVDSQGPKVAIQNCSYDAALDWEERKKILEEIILSLNSLNILSRHLTVDMSEYLVIVKNKIETFEFVLKNFLVDSQGPSLGHFLSIFYQLQNLVQGFDLYKYLPRTTKNLIFLFNLYRQHLIENQLTNHRLFPKKLLAIVSSPDLWKKKIFKLFTQPTKEIAQKSVKNLQKGAIFRIFQSKRIKLIAELCKIEVNSPLALEDIGKGLWFNLLVHKEILSPRKHWWLETYLELQNDN